MTFTANDTRTPNDTRTVSAPSASASTPMTRRAYPNGERAVTQPLRPRVSETRGRRGWAAALRWRDAASCHDDAENAENAEN